MMHAGGWFGMGAAPWLWPVIGLLVLGLLVVLINKRTRD